MTTVVGGLRARYVRDSVLINIRDILTQLGWFQSGRAHLALTVQNEPVDWQEKVDLNTLAVSEGNIPRDIAEELGSALSRHEWTYYIDFYAENDSIGLHVVHDLRDAFLGKMPSIGRSSTYMPVYDPGLTELFRVDVSRAESDRAHNFPHPWTKHWHVLILDLEDVYGADG